MTPLRVLGFCGLVSSALSALGGLAGAIWLIGLASLVMVFGNLYALVSEDDQDP